RQVATEHGAVTLEQLWLWLPDFPRPANPPILQGSQLQRLDYGHQLDGPGLQCIEALARPSHVAPLWQLFPVPFSSINSRGVLPRDYSHRQTTGKKIGNNESQSDRASQIKCACSALKSAAPGPSAQPGYCGTRRSSTRAHGLVGGGRRFLGYTALTRDCGPDG